MTPDDLAEMRRRLNQELLLIRHGFEPVLPGGRELWVRDGELYTRNRGVMAALREAVPPLLRKSTQIMSRLDKRKEKANEKHLAEIEEEAAAGGAKAVGEAGREAGASRRQGKGGLMALVDWVVGDYQDGAARLTLTHDDVTRELAAITYANRTMRDAWVTTWITGVAAPVEFRLPGNTPAPVRVDIPANQRPDLDLCTVNFGWNPTGAAGGRR